MQTVELRKKDRVELERELSKLRADFAGLVRKHRTEGLKETSVLSKKRREIARMMTVMREREILSEVKRQRSKVKSTVQK